MKYFKVTILMISLFLIAFLLSSCPSFFNSPPDKPTLIYPQNNSTGVELKPIFKWSATDKDNDPLKFDLFIYSSDDELIFSIKDISENEYTYSSLEPNRSYKWYVIAKDTNYQTKSDVYTFKTAKLPTVNLIYPESNSKSLPTDINFKWEISENEETEKVYSITFVLESDDSSITKVLSNTSSSVIISDLEYGKSYRWYLIIKTESFYTFSSSINSFTTNYFPEFVSGSPNSLDSSVEISPTLTWSFSDPDQDIKSYTLFWGTEENNLENSISNLNSTSYKLMGLEKGKIYYWKVRAYDSIGYTDSPIMSFKTNSDPQVSIKKPVSTEYFSELINPEIAFSVSDPDNDKLKATIKLYDSNLNLIASKEIANILAGSEVRENLDINLNPSSVYTLEIKVEDEKGGENTKTISFETAELPFSITSVSPENESKMIDYDNVKLQWTIEWETSTPPDNVKYKVFYKKISDTDFSYLVTTNNYLTLSDLEPGYQYQWYISIEIDDSLYDNPQVFSFTTDFKPEVSLISPEENEVILPDFTFTWDANDADISYGDSITYVLEIYIPDIDYTISSTLTENSTTINLENYRSKSAKFRVKVIDSLGKYTTSDWRNFVINSIPQIETFNVTDSSTSNVSIIPTFLIKVIDSEDETVSAILEVNDFSPLQLSLITNESTYINYISLNASTSYLATLTVTDSLNESTQVHITFRTSTPPSITSVKVDDETLTDSILSNVSVKNVKLEWHCSDDDNDDIVESQINIEKDNSTYYSTTTTENTISIPEFETSSEYKINITVKDEKQATNSITFYINTTDPPSAPTLTSPENNSILEFNNEATNSVTFTWSDSSDPNNDSIVYILRVSESSDFNEYTEATTTSNSISLTLESGKTYYWKVIAKDENYAENSSEIKSFITNSSPENVSITYPLNDATNISLTLEIKWNFEDIDDDQEYTSYIYLYKLNETETLYSTTISSSKSPNITVNLESDTTYRLKIGVKDSYSNIAYSNTIEFTTTKKPSVYNLSPTDNEILALNNSSIQNLQWNYSDPDGDTVYFKIYIKDENDTDYVYSDWISYSTEGINPRQLIDIEEAHTYQWYILAKDENEATSISELATFVVNDIPEADYSKISPSNGQKNVSLIPNLLWQFDDQVGSISYYSIYFGDSPDSLSLISTTTNTSYTLSNLKSGTNYYWEIVAHDIYEATATTGLLSFTTSYAPVLSIEYPESNSSINPEFDLNWNAYDPDETYGGEIQSYLIQIEGDSFSTSKYLKADLLSELTVHMLLNSGSYTATIIAFDDHTIEGSVTSQFSIIDTDEMLTKTFDISSAEAYYSIVFDSGNNLYYSLASDASSSWVQKFILDPSSSTPVSVQATATLSSQYILMKKVEDTLFLASTSNISALNTSDLSQQSGWNIPNTFAIDKINDFVAESQTGPVYLAGTNSASRTVLKIEKGSSTDAVLDSTFSYSKSNESGEVLKIVLKNDSIITLVETDNGTTLLEKVDKSTGEVDPNYTNDSILGEPLSLVNGVGGTYITVLTKTDSGILLTGLDEHLLKKWENVISIDGDNISSLSIKNISDSYYILSVTLNNTSIYLYKISEYGNVIWSREFDREDYNEISHDVDVANNGYIIVGSSDYNGIAQPYLIKTNSDGIGYTTPTDERGFIE